MQFTLAVYTFWIMATLIAASVVGIGVVAAISLRDIARRRLAPSLKELRTKVL